MKLLRSLRVLCALFLILQHGSARPQDIMPPEAPVDGRTACSEDRRSTSDDAKGGLLWVVTPEFARRFCMPERFVSTELKGAQAVAFGIVENAEEALCPGDGSRAFCLRHRQLRFELFLPGGTRLPERGSRSELAPRLIEDGIALATDRFMLYAVHDGTVVPPALALVERAYEERIVDGVQHLALQGAIGLAMPRMLPSKLEKLAIVVRRPRDAGAYRNHRPFSDFAHVIELPQAFTEQVRSVQKTRALDGESSDPYRLASTL